jgi:hypothetical protein
MEMSFLRGGMCVPAATVEYVRYRGRSYGRECGKSCRPYSARHDDVSAEDRFRLALGEVIVPHPLEHSRVAESRCLHALLPA